MSNLLSIMIYLTAYRVRINIPQHRPHWAQCPVNVLKVGGPNCFYFLTFTNIVMLYFTISDTAVLFITLEFFYYTEKFVRFGLCEFRRCAIFWMTSLRHEINTSNGRDCLWPESALWLVDAAPWRRVPFSSLQKRQHCRCQRHPRRRHASVRRRRRWFRIVVARSETGVRKWTDDIRAHVTSMTRDSFQRRVVQAIPLSSSSSLVLSLCATIEPDVVVPGLEDLVVPSVAGLDVALPGVPSVDVVVPGLDVVVPSLDLVVPGLDDVVPGLADSAWTSRTSVYKPDWKSDTKSRRRACRRRCQGGALTRTMTKT